MNALSQQKTLFTDREAEIRGRAVEYVQSLLSFMLVDFMVLRRKKRGEGEGIKKYVERTSVKYEGERKRNNKLTHRCYTRRFMLVESLRLQPRARQIIKDKEQILEDSS